MFNNSVTIIFIMFVASANAFVHIVGSSTDYYMKTANNTPMVMRNGPTGFREFVFQRKASNSPYFMALSSLSMMDSVEPISGMELDSMVGEDYIVYAYAGMATFSSVKNATDDPDFRFVLNRLINEDTIRDGDHVNYQNNRWRLMGSTVDGEEFDDLEVNGTTKPKFGMSVFVSTIIAMLALIV